MVKAKGQVSLDRQSTMDVLNLNLLINQWIQNSNTILSRLSASLYFWGYFNIIYLYYYK